MKARRIRHRLLRCPTCGALVYTGSTRPMWRGHPTWWLRRHQVPAGQYAGTTCPQRYADAPTPKR